MNLQLWIVGLIVWISQGYCSEILNELAITSPNYVIPIHDANLEVIQGNRDYYTLILLTSTDERHGCAVCHSMTKVIEKVSRAWYNTHGGSNGLYFINIDLIDSSNTPIFERLQIETIPHCWLIPPTDEIDYQQQDQDSDKYLIFRQSHYKFKLPQASFKDQVDLFAKFIGDLTHKQVIIEPEDQLFQFARGFVIVFVIIMFFKKIGKNYLQTIQKKYIYSTIFISLTLVFICGYQFTIMNAVPFVARNDDGLIFISGGIHYQFGIEIVLVTLNYASLGLALISLIYIGQYRVTTNSKIETELVKFSLIFLNNIILFLLYSCLTSIFMRKDSGYPYGLAKLF